MKIISTSTEKNGELKYLFRGLDTKEYIHSKKTLYLHLVNTQRILAGWQCTSPVCIAGLNHSIYACNIPPSPTNRKIIGNELGSLAEKLIYLNNYVSLESLSIAVEQGEPFNVWDSNCSKFVKISRREISDLITIELASNIEQLSRIALTNDQIKSDKIFYGKAISLLPKNAVLDIIQIYGKSIMNSTN